MNNSLLKLQMCIEAEKKMALTQQELASSQSANLSTLSDKIEGRNSKRKLNHIILRRYR